MCPSEGAGSALDSKHLIHTHTSASAKVRGKHVIKLQIVSRIKHFACLLRLSAGNRHPAASATPFCQPLTAAAPCLLCLL